MIIGMYTIANLWDDYLAKTFVEAHPFLQASGRFRSINCARTLWDNGQVADERTFAQYRAPHAELLHPSLWGRVRGVLLRRVFQGGFQRFALELVRKENAALIHAHFGTTAAQLVPLFRRAGLPVVITFYGSDASSALQSPFWRKRYQEMFPHVSVLLVLCEAVKDRLAKLGCPREKILVWNLPAGVEKYPYRMRPQDSGVKFVTAARFIEKKGHPVLLKAFQEVAAKMPGSSLTLIGYGSGKTSIIEEINRLGLRERVQLIDTEAKGDFATLYNAELARHHVFVLPSTTAKNGDDEGGPSLTLVCAQAAGLPVIATRFPGAEITVQEGVSGFFVRDNDAADLAGKMLHAAAIPERWDELGRNGSAAAMEAFSESGQMQKLMAIYDDCIAKSRI